MNKIDGTKIVRQFKTLPSIVPFYMVLFGMFFVFFWGYRPGFFRPALYHGPVGIFELPEVVHDSVIPDSSTITIKINRRGEIWFPGMRNPMRDFSDLPTMIEDRVEEKRTDSKILLVVDRNVTFEKIQIVLKAAQEGDVKVVGLVTNENACFLDFL
ncbi:MAG: hypothetical protein GY940_16380 [bacterium]|nr:hypothetical protein [bacterium]